MIDPVMIGNVQPPFNDFLTVELMSRALLFH